MQYANITKKIKEIIPLPLSLIELQSISNSSHNSTQSFKITHKPITFQLKAYHKPFLELTSLTLVLWLEADLPLLTCLYNFSLSSCAACLRNGFSLELWNSAAKKDKGIGTSQRIKKRFWFSCNGTGHMVLITLSAKMNFKIISEKNLCIFCHIFCRTFSYHIITSKSKGAHSP